MNWHERFEVMKKALPNEDGSKMTNKDISEITELKASTIKNQTQPNYKPFPKWLKLAIVIFERMSERREKNK